MSNAALPVEKKSKPAAPEKKTDSSNDINALKSALKSGRAWEGGFGSVIYMPHGHPESQVEAWDMLHDLETCKRFVDKNKRAKENKRTQVYLYVKDVEEHPGPDFPPSVDAIAKEAGLTFYRHYQKLTGDTSLPEEEKQAPIFVYRRWLSDDPDTTPEPPTSIEGVEFYTVGRDDKGRLTIMLVREVDFKGRPRFGNKRKGGSGALKRWRTPYQQGIDEANEECEFPPWGYKNAEIFRASGYHQTNARAGGDNDNFTTYIAFVKGVFRVDEDGNVTYEQEVDGALKTQALRPDGREVVAIHMTNSDEFDALTKEQQNAMFLSPGTVAAILGGYKGELVHMSTKRGSTKLKFGLAAQEALKEDAEALKGPKAPKVCK